MPYFKSENGIIRYAKGIYCWRAVNPSVDQNVFLYVGNAGARISNNTNATINRGVSEARFGGSTISTTKKHHVLDTDFIIGTVISLLERKGWECYWEHLDDDPSDENEKAMCKKYHPLLQNSSGKILPEFKHKRNPEGWRVQHQSDAVRMKLKREATMEIEKDLQKLNLL